MGIIFEPVKQPRFHRDFGNDLPKKTGYNESLATRVISAALPVLSLYRPFGRALSVGSNTSRLFFAGQEVDVSFEKVGNLALSVAAVAGSVFYSHVGMMITTSHDILLNIKGVATSDQKLLEGIKLLNNVAYMTLMCCGSLELQIVSLATQILLNVGSSANEYSKGRYFEAGTNLLMSGVRAKQMHGYVGLLRNRWKNEEADCSQVLDHIQQHLPLCGTLKNSHGFCYVDIDDAYVQELIPFIQEDDFQPPPYFGSSDAVGAHITVIYPYEVHAYSIVDIRECGRKINFYPKACKIVHPPNWKSMDQLYLVVIDSPELDQIRQNYGLPQKKHDFHITIGVKPKEFNAPILYA